MYIDVSLIKTMFVPQSSAQLVTKFIVKHSSREKVQEGSVAEESEKRTLNWKVAG